MGVCVCMYVCVYTYVHIYTQFISNNIIAQSRNRYILPVTGMGEAVFVLNGHEFSSRHNDFKFVNPSLSSTEYNTTESVPLPKVPP